MLEAHRETPPSTTSDAHGDASSAEALVQAFESVLQTAHQLPPVVAVPTTRRRRGIRRYWHSLWRPRLFLVFFLVDHARRTLDRVRRRLLATVAVDTATKDDRAAQQPVAQYLESLATHRRALYSTSLVLLTIVLTRLALLAVPGAADAFGGAGMSARRDEIDRLLSTIGNASPDLSSVDAFIAAFQAAPIDTAAFVLTSLATVLYLELRLFVPAFRLKRAMFNLYPDPALVSSTPARGSVQRAAGLYEMERAVLARLGAAPRREVPFDLIVPALLMPALLYFGWLAVRQGQLSSNDGERLLFFTIAAAAIAAAIARLGWLLRSWLRRLHPGDELYLPSEVQIHDSDLIVALRDPRSIAVATAVAALCCFGIGFADQAQAEGGDLMAGVGTAQFLILVFVIAPLWYRINRDVSAYLETRGASRPGRPVLSLLAMLVGWIGQGSALHLFTTAIVAASVYETCVQVRRVEAMAEGERHLLPPALLVPAFIAFPWTLAHIQHAINRAWRSDGEVLDSRCV